MTTVGMKGHDVVVSGESLSGGDDDMGLDLPQKVVPVTGLSHGFQGLILALAMHLTE